MVKGKLPWSGTTDFRSLPKVGQELVACLCHPTILKVMYLYIRKSLRTAEQVLVFSRTTAACRFIVTDCIPQLWATQVFIRQSSGLRCRFMLNDRFLKKNKKDKLLSRNIQPLQGSGFLFLIKLK